MSARLSVVDNTPLAATFAQRLAMEEILVGSAWSRVNSMQSLSEAMTVLPVEISRLRLDHDNGIEEWKDPSGAGLALSGPCVFVGEMQRRYLKLFKESALVAERVSRF